MEDVGGLVAREPSVLRFERDRLPLCHDFDDDSQSHERRIWTFDALPVRPKQVTLLRPRQPTTASL